MPDTKAARNDAGPEDAAPIILGNVASSVVHSVINHFSAIVSQAEMLKARPMAHEQVTTRAEAIIRAALGGSTLARRLAEYSHRITSTPPETVDLDALIAEHVEARAGEAPEGVVLVGEARARAVFPGDARRLVVMLDCLIDNAFEAFAEARRGGTVTVSTRLDASGWLELDVLDDGPGMRADVLEQALEPFSTSKAGHHGLGLPLARSIWRRHRGAFSIEAPLGRGTLVRLTRPPAES